MADDDLEIEIEGTIGAYEIQFGINQSFEATPSHLLGSDSAHPATIGRSESNGVSYWNVSASSGDSTDTRDVLVPVGAVWRYLDDGSNQGKQWRAINFDDADWKQGAGHFGYGEGDETTTFEELRTNGARIRTFYLRQKFHVDDASSIRDLTLRLLRDDGAAVYLNGTEIRRDNLAANASHTTLASSANIEDELIDSVVDPSLLIDGENVLAVEVHQASDVSGDVSFELEMVANTIPVRQSSQFIAKRSTWRYLDNGTNQRTAWRDNDFNDSTWETGRGVFGFGDGGERTQLAERNGGNRIRTYYFRKEFEVSTEDQFDELNARVSRMDDRKLDVEQFNGDQLEATGNWTPAQNVRHVTILMEFALDGFPVKAPLPIRLLNRVPPLRRIPGRVIGLGFDQQKVESPDAFASGLPE